VAEADEQQTDLGAARDEQAQWGLTGKATRRDEHHAGEERV
jgi:hypothetical protein